MITSFQVRSYLNYWLDSVDSHSLHSPFFFDFYTNVIKSQKKQESFVVQETLRRKLLENNMELSVLDLGAGSAHATGNIRKVSDIARIALTPPKFSALYARTIEHFKCKNIVELGTSLGINTLYLATSPGTVVTTFEGSPEVADIARDTFAFAEASNIRLIEGNIDKTLSEFLANTRKIDFAFMDANHRYNATVNYFRQLAMKTDVTSLIVIDDIHYSEEMENAWQDIKSSPLVYGSMDLYRAGLLFFDPSLNKQHVVLQF